MFFRRWRVKRREAIVQQWMAEQTHLPRVTILALESDLDALEQWHQSEEARVAADPLAALHVRTDDPTAKVEALWEW